jgi:hypothetical protein
MHTGLGGLNRVVLIVDGGGRASEIIDLVYLDIERERYVVADYLELWIRQEMFDVSLLTGEKIIDAQNLRAILEQKFAKMRAKKPGSACDEYSSIDVNNWKPQGE